MVLGPTLVLKVAKMRVKIHDAGLPWHPISFLMLSARYTMGWSCANSITAVMSNDILSIEMDTKTMIHPYHLVSFYGIL